MLNRHGRFLIALLILALVVLVIWLLPAGSDSSVIDKEPFSWQLSSTVSGEDIQGYIERWLTKCCKKRKNRAGREACLSVVLNQKRGRRAPELGRMIAETAQARYIDPYVLSVVVASESSFNEKTPNGTAGEQGLTQVHGFAKRQALKQGYDLGTSEGQLAAGADHLNFCKKKCGNKLVRVLSAYQSGSCRSNVYGAKLRTRRIRAERARHTARLVAIVGVNPTI